MINKIFYLIFPFLLACTPNNKDNYKEIHKQKIKQEFKDLYKELDEN